MGASTRAGKAHATLRPFGSHTYAGTFNSCYERVLRAQRSYYVGEGPVSWLPWFMPIALVVVLVISAVGLLVLRRSSSEHGPDRRSTTRRRLIHAVLLELLDADHAPRSAAELRRRVGASRPLFYDVMAELDRRQLVTSVVVPVDDQPSYRSFRLTDQGISEALLSPRARRR